MIAFLRGSVLQKTEKTIILDTGNLGYLVNLNATYMAQITIGQPIELFIHSHIREDMFDLYGFTTYEAMTFFKTMININGIGPKSAMEILNVPSEKIKAAILNEDDKYLCKIPGVGQKTAKRIILELKNKIEIETPEALSSDYQGFEPNLNNEALEALIKLGYQRHHIAQTLRTIPAELVQTEEIITYFLKNI
ncbi:MAG: Holliday junction branch migration protein RuvA [Patescibacteria group bacterium]